MHVAIVGAGFSGLAAARCLLAHGMQVTLFDSKGPGGGASGVSAGLMHPFTGHHARLNQHGREGFKATETLLKEVSDYLGQSVITHRGLLRLAFTEEQRKNFFDCSLQHADVEWLTPEQCLAAFPFSKPSLGGIAIAAAYSINPQLYVKGLWEMCHAQGAILNITAIDDLHVLQDYDAIIVASGHAANQYPELCNLSLTPIKGQILEIECPSDIPFYTKPVSSQAYVISNPSGMSYYAGATFERNFASPLPDIVSAKADLLPKLKNVFPRLSASRVIDCRAGIRASAPGPGHMPIAKHVGGKVFVLTGMGSKGLLYHALYAQKLVESICRI